MIVLRSSTLVYERLTAPLTLFKPLLALLGFYRACLTYLGVLVLGDYSMALRVLRWDGVQRVVVWNKVSLLFWWTHFKWYPVETFRFFESCLVIYWHSLFLFLGLVVLWIVGRVGIFCCFCRLTLQKHEIFSRFILGQYKLGLSLRHYWYSIAWPNKELYWVFLQILRFLVDW